MEFSKQTDAGEASAIALATLTPNAIIMIDDLEGRRLAASLNLPIIGTLGLLLKAKKENLIPSVKMELEKLKLHGFRINSDLENKILHLAKE